jgi:Mg2+-importing ATPase
MDIGRLLSSPLVAILLVASAIAAALGQQTDALIIATIVLVGASIDFAQTYRSQREADRLCASVTPTATVIRDGKWQEVARRGLVPGDVVRLSAGDLVPADARLLLSRDLSVQQSMLTGESLPTEKRASASEDPIGGGPESTQLVFLGTSVISGTGEALVTATGPRTVFGDIARRLGTRAPESEFEHGLRRFSLLILRTTVALVLFIALVGLATRRSAFDSLLFAVALGVGLTPEFLPMIVSVTLTAGATRMSRDGVIVKRLRAIQNLGSIDVLCTDKTGTLTTGEMRVDQSVDPEGRRSDGPLQLAYVNSSFETGIRSPLDAAILDGRTFDVTRYTKIDEIPFDFDRRRLSVVVDTPDGSRMLIAKGAPESVLPLCEAADIRAAQIADAFAADGRRTLAIAYREIDRRPTYSRDDEVSLTLAGFVAFADPVRADAARTIGVLADDGVAVKVLTGDNEQVARHLCGRVGLNVDEVVTGDRLARLDDAALGHVAESATVFARVSPAQKNRIIAALKRRGHVVGFLGDGINDAPSLHTADVGISVVSATDVAREAADIVLGQSGLAVLHRGIVEGRRAAGNLMKYLLMDTSSNFGNMFSMAAASVFLPFLPMLPTQILLNNFLYDLAQIAIPTDDVDRDYLKRPQRWNLDLVKKFMLVIGPVSSVFDFLTFFVMLRLMHASETVFHTGWFVESLATQTLVVFVIRTFGNPLRSRPSATLVAMTVSIVSIALALPATPIGTVLGFTVPPPGYFVFLVGAVASYLWLVEIVKRRVMAVHEPKVAVALSEAQP